MSRRKSPLARPAFWLVALYLASLSVKGLQEVRGIRVLSSIVPILLLLLLPRLRLRVPRALRWYLGFACLGLPLLSAAVKGGMNIYEPYFVVTVLASVAVLLVCVDGLRLDMTRVMRAYADIMVVMCILSVFTAEKQWFGGYSLRGFSDFATFFALQVSIAVPFLAGRFLALKRIVCLVVLFLTFSRLSFVLALAVVLLQTFQANRRSFYAVAPLLIGLVVVVSTFTSIGSLMTKKLANVLAAATGTASGAELNPSDLGRLAYATVTVDSFDNAQVLLFGHGIKTNRDLISARLDVATWGLDEDLADATVHNVYLEMLSDVGAVGLAGFLAVLLFVVRRVRVRFGLGSPQGLALCVFAISYLFEANYVSFFFQFFMCYFLWIASAPRPRMARELADGASLRMFGKLALHD